MGLIGKTIGAKRLIDFKPVSEVAKELKIHPTTLKRWLKMKIVKNVIWGRDRRKWIYVHKDSIRLLSEYMEQINIKE